VRCIHFNVVQSSMIPNQNRPDQYFSSRSCHWYHDPLMCQSLVHEGYVFEGDDDGGRVQDLDDDEHGDDGGVSEILLLPDGACDPLPNHDVAQ